MVAQVRLGDFKVFIVSSSRRSIKRANESYSCVICIYQSKINLESFSVTIRGTISVKYSDRKYDGRYTLKRRKTAAKIEADLGRSFLPVVPLATGIVNLTAMG